MVGVMKHADPFDPTDTRLRPLAEYADRLPSRRRGRRLNRATLWRWAMRGARGGKVLLHTVRLGSGRFTSDADFAAFMRELEEDRRQPEPESTIDDEQVATIQKRFGATS